MTDAQVLDLVARHPFSTPRSAVDAKLVVAPLNSKDIAAVSEMTFPAFRPHLARCLAGEAHDGFESIALVARDDDVPVGLALAQLPLTVEAQGGDAPAPKTARLLSISVMPAWRHRGAATRLVMAVEDELRARGCVRFATGYTTRMPEWQGFERLLAACRWSQPDAGLLLSTASIAEVMKGPWLSTPLEAPPGFELFEWTQLSAGERAQLQHEVATGAIPRGLSPFADEEEMEPAISVGVRHGGEVVAWMIVIRSPWLPNALCYRSQFVRPQLRSAQALGPLSLAAAIRRHAASPIGKERPLAVFGISMENAAKQINFFRKRLSPYCFSTYESRSATKSLA